MVNVYAIDYIIMAVLIIISAIMALEAREIVYAIFFFDLFTIGIGGMFLLFNAGYVAMFQLAVYAGAVAVTVLFAVMLTRRTATGKEIISFASIRNKIASLVLALSIAALMLILVSRYDWATPAGDYPDPLGGGAIFTSIVTNYVVPFLGISLILAASLVGSVALLREERSKKEVASK
ncbi:MAG: NADH-quinone oxidoreductase subunit J [Candidatus Heimdallarchaeum aukensis]|uniref:NADH-quinone oxidoreductase subunit J n=1 Tax=Candidatus Heimdallarchaeum aukensis TaxID=2876573 RepID=A0A9Y1BKL6_9ARCH|nr:MAG: NADH-quinone oxidoreductase subunit J [Candidatus Heimdallarchaeum aukensis]